MSSKPSHVPLITSHLSLRSRQDGLFLPRLRCLQVSKNSLGASQGDAGLGLLGGVDDLAVVDDDGVAVRPLGTGPFDARGKLEPRVAHEQLSPS